MQTDRFTPPTAEVQDMTTGSARPRRPISVWILQAVLVGGVLMILYAFLRLAWAIGTHQLVLNSTGMVLLGLGWRTALLVAVVMLIVWLHRGRHFARWLGLAVITCLGIAQMMNSDPTNPAEFANEAERAGGMLGSYLISPLLYLWWAYAAAFSAKAKAYFGRDRR